ncbi:hypothetical protein VTJ49DRAFT_1005 [Mycothermus thermophilus]|uniref:Histidine kinase group protein n=1 Tax=Humicola insolens TaxID=85995 RepID=A0ABR3VDY2_HUMIN
MPIKKRTDLAADHADNADGREKGAPSMTSSLPSPPSTVLRPKTKSAAAPQPPPSHSHQVLVICRNNPFETGFSHWRYISSFHGPWLQLPPEILETIANANYNTPRPRPIDPAVFFDLIKIRRLVDDATNLAVRAASGVASIGQRNVPGASHHAAALGFGFGLRPPPQTKLSAERKHRMREQATQKLTEAYRLDEIACSVATMQSTSSLEEVASLVLQRNPQDPDAKYVHFFHEKIPSRQLAQCTSLTPLNEIAASKPTDPEPLRTRAMVRVFKGDYQGAADDLTEALKLYRLYRPAHLSKTTRERSLSERQPAGRRQEDIILKEEEQPSSLETQLLFQRAGVYLTIACRHVAAAIPPDSPHANGHAGGEGQKEVLEEDGEREPSPAEKEAQRRMAEARKLVRHNAKRALRDYTAYLSHFEYSPDLPISVAEDFTRKVNSAVNGGRPPRPSSHALATSEGDNTVPHHRIYALSDLFTSSPPAGLPPYPSTDVVLASSTALPENTTESLTCHPLLADALHSLLLCHALIQTSAKELLRHAYMVARLVRLADGYPVFQSSRCPARADWVEVLRAAGNWIRLVGSWDELCAPAPLGGLFQAKGTAATPGRGPQPAALDDGSQTSSAPETSSPTTTTALATRPRNASDDTNANANGNTSTPASHTKEAASSLPHFALPASTDRAAAIARWVLEAPLPSASANGTPSPARRRRRKPGTGSAAGRKAVAGGGVEGGEAGNVDTGSSAPVEVGGETEE